MCLYVLLFNSRYIFSEKCQVNFFCSSIELRNYSCKKHSIDFFCWTILLNRALQSVNLSCIALSKFELHLVNSEVFLVLQHFDVDASYILISENVTLTLYNAHSHSGFFYFIFLFVVTVQLSMT